MGREQKDTGNKEPAARAAQMGKQRNIKIPSYENIYQRPQGWCINDSSIRPVYSFICNRSVWNAGIHCS
jgi:hypothetical protein